MTDVEIGSTEIPDAGTLSGAETVTVRTVAGSTGVTTAAEVAALLRDPAVVDDGNAVWDALAGVVTTESQAMFASRVLQALGVEAGDGEYLLKGTGGPAVPPSSGSAWTPDDFTDGTIPIGKLDTDIATQAELDGHDHYDTLGWIDARDDSRLDPTGAVDSTAALNAMIIAADAAKASLFVPPGTYRTDSSLEYLSGSTIEGAGKGKTILDHRGSGPAFASGEGARSYRNELKKFTVQKNAAATSVMGIDWDSISLGTLEDVLVIGFDRGVEFNSTSGAVSTSLYNDITRLDVRGADEGVVLTDQSNSNWFHSFIALGNVVGMLIESGNNCSIHGGAFEGNTAHGLLIDQDTSSSGWMNSVHGVRFESNPLHWEVRDADTLHTSFYGNTYFGGSTLDNASTTHRFEWPMGVFGGVATAKLVVTGSRATTTPLTELLAVLANFGLVDDQTTA